MHQQGSLGKATDHPPLSCLNLTVFSLLCKERRADLTSLLFLRTLWFREVKSLVQGSSTREPQRQGWSLCPSVPVSSGFSHVSSHFIHLYNKHTRSIDLYASPVSEYTAINKTEIAAKPRLAGKRNPRKVGTCTDCCQESDIMKDRGQEQLLTTFCAWKVPVSTPFSNFCPE